MRTPPCPYFSSCGGCTIQHLDYAAQVANKKKTVAQLLKIPEDQVTVFADSEFNYRNRMDFIFHPRGLGLRERGDWRKIVDVQQCLISDEKLNILLKEVRDFFKPGIVDVFDVQKKKGSLRYAVIRTPRGVAAEGDSSITFILNEDCPYNLKTIDLIEQFAKKTTAKNILFGFVTAHTDISTTSNYVVVKGSEYLRETFMEKTFTYHTQSFFQNNSAMAERMLAHVRSLFETDATGHADGKNGDLLDLYGGVGTFGIVCADLFDHVYIVEEVDISIDCAKKNIVANSIPNAAAYVLNADSINKLPRETTSGAIEKTLSVITDPPRSGMALKAIKRLLELHPRKIIYISCNPPQFAKESSAFASAGYAIKSVAIFDLFPQTNHFELVVEMER